MSKPNLFNHDFSSVLSQLRLDGDIESAVLTKLLACAPPPPDAAGITHAVRGAASALLAALSFIKQPNEVAQKIKDGAAALQMKLDSIALTHTATELAAPRGRRLVQYPAWKMLIALGQVGSAQPCMIAGGLLLLRALHFNRRIPRAQALAICRETQRCELSTQGLYAIFESDIDASETAYPWLLQLQRLWPQLLNLFSADPGSEASKEPTFVQRVRGQLIAAAEHASIPHRAGTPDHRHLSDRQFRIACKLIADWNGAGDWRGVFAETAALTHLTADLLGAIPLASSALGGWVTILDAANGCVQSDCSCLAQEAAVPPKQHGCVVPSGYIRTASYSSAAAAVLRTRHARFPAATTLSELFPEAPSLRGDMPLFDSKDEIQPSWARWIRSFGLQMCRHGHDRLHAATLSCDFGLIARSKLYYATLPNHELWEATDRFYKQIGWSGATPSKTTSIAFGCRVVPTWPTLIAAAQHQLKEMAAIRPGKNQGLAKVLEFHNRYVRAVALRMAVLLGLREGKVYDLWADIDERQDLWVDLLDKCVPGAQGASPVPLCEYVRNLIKQFRVHCAAMAFRLQTMGHKNTPLHLWLLAVVARERVHLLCTTVGVNRITPVGSAEAIGRVPSQFGLAPDFGRKLLENQMRCLTSREPELVKHLSLKTCDIDAMLRHEVLGQWRFASSSDFVLIEWADRAIRVLDAIACDAFGDVPCGLSKE